ncbi:nucleoporin NUP35-like isoform X3 [Zophobas morio]|uniref:nucleoporin NUP35-like isoform X3 n=1 Tax=Zophobas morio TaxID=2755281 RepID=UPI00308334E2
MAYHYNQKKEAFHLPRTESSPYFPQVIYTPGTVASASKHQALWKAQSSLCSPNEAIDCDRDTFSHNASHVSPLRQPSTTSKRIPFSGKIPTDSIMDAAPHDTLGSYNGCVLADFGFPEPLSLVSTEQDLNLTAYTEHKEEESDALKTVTIYGFSLEHVSRVLKYFDQYGTITDHWLGPDGANWIHVKFSSASEAQLALSKHGNVIGNIMIGVTLYQKKNDTTQKLRFTTASRPSVVSTVKERHIVNPLKNSLKGRQMPLYSFLDALVSFFVS